MADVFQKLSAGVDDAVRRLKELNGEVNSLRAKQRSDAEKIRQLEEKILDFEKEHENVVPANRQKMETVSRKLGEIIKKLETAG